LDARICSAEPGSLRTSPVTLSWLTLHGHVIAWLSPLAGRCCGVRVRPGQYLGPGTDLNSLGPGPLAGLSHGGVTACNRGFLPGQARTFHPVGPNPWLLATGPVRLLPGILLRSESGSGTLMTCMCFPIGVQGCRRLASMIAATAHPSDRLLCCRWPEAR
jgi:hypothetical protein